MKTFKLIISLVLITSLISTSSLASECNDFRKWSVGDFLYGQEIYWMTNGNGETFAVSYPMILYILTCHNKAIRLNDKEWLSKNYKWIPVQYLTKKDIDETQ
jgi:hypothetical protein